MLLIRINKSILLVAVITVLLNACGGGTTELDEGNPLGTQAPDNGNPTDPIEETPTGSTGETAFNLYEQQCAMCHGSDGEGGLAGGELHNCNTCGSEEELFETILATMPLANAQMCDSDCSRKLAHFIFNDFDAVAGGVTNPDPVLPAPTAAPTPIVTPLPTATPMPVPTTTPTVTPAPLPVTPTPTPSLVPGLPGFVFCSEESRFWEGQAGRIWCEFSGTREVAFGANGVYAFREATGSIECSFQVFGDPLPGVSKACYVSTDDTPAATPTPTPPLDGQALFSSKGCVSCHQNNERRIWNGTSADTIRTAMRTVSEMAIFIDNASSNGTSLSEAELEAIANYIARTFEPPDDPVSGPKDVEPPACNFGALPSVAPLHRLSKRYYQNILNELFKDSVSENILSSVAELVASMPADGEVGQQFSNMDTRVSAAHIDDYINIASVLAGAVSESASARETLAGVCVNLSPVPQACAESFIEEFGLRIYRRPLTTNEVERYLELWHNDIEGPLFVNDTVLSFLLAPQFIYVFENRGTEIDGNARHLNLTAYELATRMALHFWQSAPDENLFNAAATGELLNESVFRAQVDRMAADPRTLQTILDFFEEWLKIAPARSFPSTAIFDAVYADVDTSPQLYDAMRQEVRDLITYHVWENEGTFADILTTDLNFARSSDLGDLYGVGVWDGVSDPTGFASGERSGILTRSALLLQVTGRTNPIKRGARIRNDILCEALEVPPDLPSEAFELPPVADDQSTRERYHNKTSAPSCNQCHSLINAPGFALEEYDGLGRYRDTERIVNDFGVNIGEVPLDTAVVPQLRYGDAHSVSGSIELMNQLATHPKAHACFARQYFRYTFRRPEQLGDGCVVSAISDVIASGNFIDAWKSIALRQEFKQRVLGEAQ